MSRKKVDQEMFYNLLALNLSQIGWRLSSLKSNSDLDKFSFIAKELDELESQIGDWFLLVDEKIARKQFDTFSKNALNNSLFSFTRLEEVLDEILDVENYNFSDKTLQLIFEIQKSNRILINIIYISLDNYEEKPFE